MSTAIRAELRDAIVEAGRTLVSAGLTVGTWGNLSTRDIATNLVYIKPSGIPYEGITPEDVVVLDLDGRLLAGCRRPSIETPFHLAIYRARTDVCAIIHTHAVYSSAFAVTHQDIPALTEDFATLVGERVSCARYAFPGTSELARNVVEALADRAAVLLPNHGAVCVGPDLRTAITIAALVEKTAHMYLLARQIGTPHTLSLAEVEALREFARSSYGQRKT